MVLKEAKIRDEAELESLLLRDPNQIEEHFLILTQRKKTLGSRRLPFLGVDSRGVVTLIELSVTRERDQLRRALEQYDWLLEQAIDWIPEIYEGRLQGVVLSDHMPQLYLIAPDFDDHLLREARYIRTEIKLRLFRYLALEVNGTKEIKLLEAHVPPLRVVEPKPKVTENKEPKVPKMPPVPIRKPEKKPVISEGEEPNLNEMIKECVGEELYRQLEDKT